MIGVTAKKIYNFHTILNFLIQNLVIFMIQNIWVFFFLDVFTYFFIHFLVSFSVCVCVCVCSIPCMWMSEYNFWESIQSVHMWVTRMEGSYLPIPTTSSVLESSFVV
jgi:hypothetical protein